MTPKTIETLKALSIYKFLSRKQMARLKIAKHSSAFSRLLNPLIKANFIGKIDATNYGLGHIYFLTKKGAKNISIHLYKQVHEINYCKNKPNLSPQTIHHRTYAIDIQIAIFQACSKEEIPIIFYDREIDTVGSIKKDGVLKRKTRVELPNSSFIEPDAIFMLDTLKGRKLFCVELEHKDFTKKSVAKVKQHILALNSKSVSKKYGHNKAHRCLFVFINNATKSAVVDSLNKIRNIHIWFKLISIDEFLLAPRSQFLDY